jgi:hypothetical protein
MAHEWDTRWFFATFHSSFKWLPWFMLWPPGFGTVFSTGWGSFVFTLKAEEPKP